MWPCISEKEIFQSDSCLYTLKNFLSVFCVYVSLKNYFFIVFCLCALKIKDFLVCFVSMYPDRKNFFIVFRDFSVYSRTMYFPKTNFLMYFMPMYPKKRAFQIFCVGAFYDYILLYLSDKLIVSFNVYFTSDPPACSALMSLVYKYH